MRLILNSVFLFLLCAEQLFAATSTQTDALQRYGLGILAEWGSPSFSECGKLVYSAGGFGGALMDADSNETPRMFPIYGGANQCDVSADGKRFLLGTHNLNTNSRIREAMIYNSKKGKWEATLHGADVDIISGAQFSPDDQRVITLGQYYNETGYYNRMKVWDSNSGALLREMVVNENNCLAVAPTGSLAAACGENTISIWDYSTGQLVKTIVIPGMYSYLPVATFYDQNRKLIVAGPYLNRTFVVDVETGSLISTIYGSSGAFALSPDESKMLIETSTGSKLIRMSDKGTIRSYPNLWVQSPKAFSPDGSQAVMVGPDLSVVVVDVATGEQISCHDRFNGDVTELAVSPDGKKIALARTTGLDSGVIDYSVPIMDTATGALISSIPLNGSAYSARFSPDGTRLLIGGDSQTTLWDATSAQKLMTLNATGLSVCFTPDGKKALVTSEGSGKWIHYWNLQTNTSQTFASGGALDLAISPDGTKLLTASYLKVSLYNLTTLQHIRDYDITFAGGSATIYKVAFSPDGTKVAAAGIPLLRMWDVNGTLIRDFNIRECTFINGVLFSPDGTQLAAGLHNMVWVYNVSTGGIMRKFRAHNDMVSCLAFSPDGKRVYSGGWDGQAYQWSNEWKETRVNDKLLIVAGGTTDCPPLVAGSIRTLADWAYLTAGVRGYSASCIQYLSAFDTSATNPNVTGVASAAAVQNAITTWGADSSRLLVLMIGKGQREGNTSYFVTGGTQASPERISSAQLAASLNAAQSAAVPLPEALVVIDASYSGGFLSSLAPVPSGTQRLVIASCGENQTAVLGVNYGHPGVPSFTASFISSVFQGRTFAKAFLKAKQSLSHLAADGEEVQMPLLDDNGDGLYTKSDGDYADQIIFGSLPEAGYQDVTISNFTATSSMDEGASATLEVEVTMPENIELARVEAFLTKNGGETFVPVFFAQKSPAPSAANRPAGAAATVSFQATIPHEVSTSPGDYVVVFNAVRDDGLGCDLLSDPTHGTLTVIDQAHAKAWLEYR